MKTIKKWSKMLMLGMSAMVLAFGLVVAGCDDGNIDDHEDRPPEDISEEFWVALATKYIVIHGVRYGGSVEFKDDISISDFTLSTGPLSLTGATVIKKPGSDDQVQITCSYAVSSTAMQTITIKASAFTVGADLLSVKSESTADDWFSQ